MTQIGFINPFFIGWSDDSIHPSADQTPKCRLDALLLTSPNEPEIKSLLKKNDVKLSSLIIREGTHQLTIKLNTPKGSVTFEDF